MSAERAQLERMADAVDNALAAMLLAHDEMFFGGDWESAKARLRDAGLKLDKALTTANRTLNRQSPRMSFEYCLALPSRNRK